MAFVNLQLSETAPIRSHMACLALDSVQCHEALVPPASHAHGVLQKGARLGSRDASPLQTQIDIT